MEKVTQVKEVKKVAKKTFFHLLQTFYVLLASNTVQTVQSWYQPTRYRNYYG